MLQSGWCADSWKLVDALTELVEAGMSGWVLERVCTVSSYCTEVWVGQGEGHLHFLRRRWRGVRNEGMRG